MSYQRSIYIKLSDKNKNSIFLGGRSVNNKILNYLVRETFKKLNLKRENLRILLCGLSLKDIHKQRI